MRAPGQVAQRLREARVANGRRRDAMNLPRRRKPRKIVRGDV
jgi:hypothetical protein